MHYIIGTYFVTPQRLGTTENDKKLSPATQYYLTYIQKEKEGNSVTYTFIGGNRKTINLTFSSCREADKFIARFKKENIPDYDNVYSARSETEN